MPSTTTRAAWLLVALAVLSFIAFGSPSASAFCGFYVGKADAKLFNEASQVILVRDGDRTVIPRCDMCRANHVLDAVRCCILIRDPHAVRVDL